MDVGTTDNPCFSTMTLENSFGSCNVPALRISTLSSSFPCRLYHSTKVHSMATVGTWNGMVEKGRIRRHEKHFDLLRIAKIRTGDAAQGAV